MVRILSKKQETRNWIQSSAVMQKSVTSSESFPVRPRTTRYWSVNLVLVKQQLSKALHSESLQVMCRKALKKRKSSHWIWAHLLQVQNTVANLRNVWKQFLKKSKRARVKSSSSSMNFIWSSAPVKQTVQWTQATCWNLCLPEVSCTVLVQPHWMSIVSTLKKTLLLHVVSSQSWLMSRQ